MSHPNGYYPVLQTVVHFYSCTRYTFFARGNGRKGQKGLSGQNHTIALNGDVAPY